MCLKYKTLYFVFLFSFFASNAEGNADIPHVVRIASMEKEPYSGQKLLNNGYVHEIISAAFNLEGLKVELEFYPPARAKYLAQIGEVDAVAPVRFANSDQSYLLYSSAFPRGKIGFLKKKSLVIPPLSISTDSLTDTLKSLKNYRFGVLRNVAVSPEFDQANFLSKTLMVEELQNLDMLAKDRIDLAVFDKYTAADLMINQRPHLIGQLEFIQAPVFDRDFYLGFSKHKKHHEYLANTFNQGLIKLANSGALQSILTKHGFYHFDQIDNSKNKLVIAAVNINHIEQLKKLSRGFENAHPDIQLDWRIMQEGVLRKRVLADFAISDAQYDIVMVGPYETPLWAEKGWLSPIENLPAGYELSDVFPAVKQVLSFNNEQYALPISSETAMTYYRKDLFQQAGIKAHGKPTLFDIKNYAKSVHNPKKGIYGIGLRGKPGWGQNMALISLLVKAHGGTWFDKDWAPQLMSEQWHDAIKYYVELLTQYGPPNPVTKGWQENQQLFMQGKLGVLIDATSLAGYITDPSLSAITENLGFSNFPSGFNTSQQPWFWTWAMAVSSDSKKKERAKQFIVWLTSQKSNQSEIELKNQYVGLAGVRYSDFDNKMIKTSPISQFIRKSLHELPVAASGSKVTHSISGQFELIPEFPAIGFQVGMIIGEILQGKMTVEQGLAESQKTVYQIMKNAGYYNNLPDSKAN